MTIALISIAVLEIAAGITAVTLYRRTAHAAADRRLAFAVKLEERDRELHERQLVLDAWQDELKGREAAAAKHAERVPVLTEVLVNTKRPDDQAIRGLLDLEVGGPVLHLVDAKIIDGENELPAPEVRVERDHVAYMQIL